MDSDPDPGGLKNTDPDPQHWFEFSSIDYTFHFAVVEQQAAYDRRIRIHTSK
jgi:hypothetical protein